MAKPKLAPKPKPAAHSSITVRGLPPGVKQRLRERAARHGRSLEAEAREILQGATAHKEESALDVFNRIRARFHALDGDEDLQLPTRREMWKDRPLPNFDD
ncbi:MAG TPA: Arc family DNA-binding protein [Terriglobales bacterium]|jgi:plasmid stability protein